MKNFNNIDNIIFDLGGVLFKLDTDKTFQEFENHGITTKTFENSEDLFLRFETGKISPKDYLLQVNNICNSSLSMEEFKYCWNAMIGEYPEKNRQLLEKLSKKFNLYVLSNTNEIHVEYFIPIANWREGLFKKIYFSNEIGYRKPDLDCYKFVLNDAAIDATRTLFIDDRVDNIAGAAEVGINTIRLSKQEDLYKIFDEYL